VSLTPQFSHDTTTAFYSGYNKALNDCSAEFKADIVKAERDAYEQGLIEGRDRLEHWMDKVDAVKALLPRFERQSTSVCATDIERAAYADVLWRLKAALGA